jgi:putative membrane protein
MSDLIRQSVHGIGPHFVYFALALVVATLFAAIYIRITPYREFTLIRQGNAAAAISLGGALLGFSLPLAKAVAQSANVLDMLIWAGVALVAQLIAFIVARAVLKDMTSNIEQGKPAAAIFLAAVSISIGLLNSAAMTQ